MQKFNITIFNQFRVIIGLFLSPIALFLSVFIAIKTDVFILSIGTFILILFGFYYFAVGHLTVIFDAEEIIFEWKKKIIFNHRPPLKIEINTIEKVIIDEGKILRKIITKDSVIPINNVKLNSKENIEFINTIRKICTIYDVKIVNSWDAIQDKGYLSILYKINAVVIIIAIILVIIITILKGFNPKVLSIFFLFIPQMFLYKKQMRNSIKK